MPKLSGVPSLWKVFLGTGAPGIDRWRVSPYGSACWACACCAWPRRTPLVDNAWSRLAEDDIAVDDSEGAWRVCGIDMADDDANVGATDGIVIDDAHAGGDSAVDDSQSARRVCGRDMANDDLDAVCTGWGFGACRGDLVSTYCSVTRAYSGVLGRSL
jgi:hypothetical protein